MSSGDKSPYLIPQGHGSLFHDSDFYQSIDMRDWMKKEILMIWVSPASTDGRGIRLDDEQYLYGRKGRM